MVTPDGRRSHLDGQHDVRVALQHLHGAAVADVLEAHPVGSEDLVTHLYSVLLSQTTRIQPERARREGLQAPPRGEDLNARRGGGTDFET